MINHELATSRLALRPCTLDDASELHALWTDPGVRKYLWDDTIIPMDTVVEVINASQDSFETHGFGQWAVTERGASPIIGFAGLRHVDGGPLVEVLYGIHPGYWGRGYAVEAARAVLDHGFNQTSLTEIIADTDPPNTASIRVMEKLGMTRQPSLVRDGLPTIRYSLRKG